MRTKRKRTSLVYLKGASVALAWIFPDEATESSHALRERLTDELAIVPSLWSIEIANALLMATQRRRIAVSDWTKLCDALSALPIEVDVTTHEQALTVALPLAYAHRLSAYDAVYLELARRMKLPLATVNRDLRRAAVASKVALMI